MSQARCGFDPGARPNPSRAIAVRIQMVETQMNGRNPKSRRVPNSHPLSALQRHAAQPHPRWGGLVLLGAWAGGEMV